MRFFTVPNWCWIVLISSLPLTGASQTLEESYRFGLEQMEACNYPLAIEVFHRVLFFDDGRFASSSTYQLARAYRLQSEWSASARLYDQAYILSNPDQKVTILFEKALVLAQMGLYQQAMLELYNLPDSLSASQKTKRDLYSGAVFYQMGDLTKARESWSAIIRENADAARQLEKLMDESARADRYNPQLAGIMSLIIPGSGQLYAGAGRDAINSFLLIGTLDYLFITLSVRYSLLDAYLTVFPWIQRYYHGGYKAAVRLTIEKKERIRQEKYQELLNLLDDQIRNELPGT
jgi:tetratricopeptide (TPR) repeat protein